MHLASSVAECAKCLLDSNQRKEEEEEEEEKDDDDDDDDDENGAQSQVVLVVVVVEESYEADISGLAVATYKVPGQLLYTLLTTSEFVWHSLDYGASNNNTSSIFCR
ncbi:hypothetical protein LguiB_016912 [Lonicera macranthoides]